jgi:arabinose-5-phosphate isomerase
MSAVGSSVPVDSDAAAPDLDAARRVLARESQALDELGQSLGQSFVDAVEHFFQTSGRVVVCGMGKSGHVARKIAATFASTGTPAQFVHPSEASHGDLGMVTTADAVLVLSKSGENAELSDVVTYAKRFDIPLVAVTGDSDSTLGRAADITIVLPPVPEACPMGLAPTTSTTMMIALGDALAVALLERRGFSADDFQVLHPGGRLGRRLIKVADLMRTGDEMPLVSEDALMGEVVLAMSAKNFGCAGVVASNGRLAGMITDGDLRRHMSDDLLTRSAASVMTANPKSIRPDALAAEAVGLMAGSITNLFVVENGRAVGILRMHDCLVAGVA